MPSTQIFASPLRFDDKWAPQPYLAETWKLDEDGKSLTLNLRKNAVFHDGKPITSADVAFSLLAMSPALCPILPKHIYGDGQDLKTHPRNSTDVVGSGPFKFVEFKAGQRV